MVATRQFQAERSSLPASEGKGYKLFGEGAYYVLQQMLRMMQLDLLEGSSFEMNEFRYFKKILYLHVFLDTYQTAKTPDILTPLPNFHDPSHTLNCVTYLAPIEEILATKWNKMVPSKEIVTRQENLRRRFRPSLLMGGRAEAGQRLINFSPEKLIEL